MKYNKVIWKKIEDESLLPGDFWASHDPNKVEVQATTETGFPSPIQLQAVGSARWGRNPAFNDPVINLGHGAYWRPICVQEMQLVPAEVET